MNKSQKDFRVELAAAVNSLLRAQCTVSDEAFDVSPNMAIYTELLKSIRSSRKAIIILAVDNSFVAPDAPEYKQQIFDLAAAVEWEAEQLAAVHKKIVAWGDTL